MTKQFCTTDEKGSPGALTIHTGMDAVRATVQAVYMDELRYRAEHYPAEPVDCRQANVEDMIFRELQPLFHRIRSHKNASA